MCLACVSVGIQLEMVLRAFNPSTWGSETGKSLSLGPAWFAIMRLCLKTTTEAMNHVCILCIR